MVNQTLYYHNDDITKGVWRGRGQPFFPHQASCPLLTASDAVSISMENTHKSVRHRGKIKLQEAAKI